MAKPPEDEIVRIVNESASRKQAAERLGIAVPTLYLWIRGLEGIKEVPKGRKLGSKNKTKNSVGKPATEKPVENVAKPKNPRMTDEEKFLWESYWKDRSDENRNALAEYYDSWVERITYRRIKSVPDSVDKEAILQAAKISLLDLIRTYDGSTKFTTYGALRVHGATMDEMRAVDIVPRLTRTRERKRKALLDEGKDPEAHMRPKDYLDSHPTQFDSFDRQVYETDSWKTVTIGEMLGDSDQLTEYQKAENFRYICRGCNLEEQTILYLYYYKGKTMKQIGQALDLSESRISQMHTQMIAKLEKSGLEQRTTV